MIIFKRSSDHPLVTQCSAFQKIQSIPVQTSTGMGLAAVDFNAFDLKSMCIMFKNKSSIFLIGDKQPEPDYLA